MLMLGRRYAVVVRGIPIKLFWTLGGAENWRVSAGPYAYIYHYGHDVERKKWVWYKVDLYHQHSLNG